MRFTVECECGRVLDVDLDQARGSVDCPCGRSVRVPSVGGLIRGALGGGARWKGWLRAAGWALAVLAGGLLLAALAVAVLRRLR